MRVTRITIDADLGLIELQTGPGGDGDYVLLPLEIAESLQRYVTMAGEPCTVEQTMENPTPELTTRLSGGTITFAETGTYKGAPAGPGEIAFTAPGGWCVPADQAYDYNTTPGVGAYDAEISDPPRFERGGWKYGQELDAVPAIPRGGIEYTRSPELQKEFDKYLAADKDECDGNCGAHPVKKGRDDDVWTRAPGEGEPSKERHTGPATITNPIKVFADEHSRGYRLHSPALPGWRADINRYDLHKVPGMIREALVDMGSDHAINYPVTITVMEEEQ